MRLVSAVLFVALTGSAVLADEAKPADPKPEVTKKKVPYRVVKMLPETGQVLLFDKTKGAHVVAEVGQALDGYTVDDIDEDEITLVADNGASVILTAPPVKQHKHAAKKAPAPVDPYAEPGEAKADADATDATSGAGKPADVPVDPYAEPAPPKAPGEGGVRVASAGAASTSAPIVDAGPGELSDPYGDPGIAAFAEAVGAAPATPSKPDKPAKAAKGAKKPAAKAATPEAAAALAAAATGGTATGATSTAADASGDPGTVTLARSELDAALADFGKLAGSFHATFTGDGLRFDSIHEGSLLAKLGLRKGDVITAVDGRPLHSLDDAASLYARLSAVKNAAVSVTRAGKPVTLRVAIR
jgi:membrane-associated protease RseP (regulator of RpoE activity)